MDVEQIRLFNKPFDMTYLLGIENNIVVTPNRLRPFDYIAHWDGIDYSFSSKTSVGEIFINETIDVNLKSSCVLELNTVNISGNKVLDSSGNGNIGILIGDYSLTKDAISEPIVREGNVKTPEQDSKNGAL